jgi:hypothetical protein
MTSEISTRKLFGIIPLETIPYAVDCASHPLIGFFKRVVDLSFQVKQRLFPQDPHLQLPLGAGLSKPTTRLDETTISKFSDPAMQQKLQGLLSRVDAIRTKMGIAHEIRVFLVASEVISSLMPCSSGELMARSGSDLLIRHSFILNGRIDSVPEGELDYLIARELSHVRHNYEAKYYMRSSAVLIAELAVGYFYSPLAIPLIEAIDRPLSLHQWSLAEKEAELTAIKTLGTSEGAIASLTRVYELNRLHSKGGCPFYTPEGEYILNYDHPSLKERIAYCKKEA